MNILRNIALICLLAVTLPCLAQGRGKASAPKNPDTYLDQAEEAILAYDLDAGQEALDKYQAAMKRARKEPSPQLQYLQTSLLDIRNMMDRVDDIVVIDSMTVDAAEFWRHYRLSADAGAMVPARRLPKGVQAAPEMPVYASHDGQTVLWSVTDTLDNDGLMEGTVLLDGTLDDPHPVDMGLADTASVDYPWLMPDGSTLYFAYDGPGSIGGYDIFMTRRDGQGGWYAPQNMGMPYNSPADDYMMAIDEATGLGWWATDRWGLDSLVTIYIFVPNEVRNNLPADIDNLASRARLSSVADTQQGRDMASLRHRLDDLRAQLAPSDDDTYARTTPQHTQYTEALEQYKTQRRHLQLLRRQYARGNKGVGANILDLEQRLPQKRLRLRQLRNALIQSRR